MSVLYFSYDGATEPLGQSQIIPYLTRLRARGRAITLVTFEKPDTPPDRLRRCTEQLADARIDWIPLRYHKRPTVPATAYDMSRGVLAGLQARLRGRIDVLHARAHVPAMMCLPLKPLLGARFLFDVRNLWADEKVDAGTWPRGGALWRGTKAMERRFLLAADEVVTLTERARAELLGFDYLRDRPPPITVIPTCVDLEVFRRDHAAPHDPAAPVVVYSGSLGGRYQDAQVGRFFAALHRRAPKARLEIWSRQDPASIVSAATLAGALAGAIRVSTGTRNDVAAALARADLGISLLNDGYSNRSSLPTKIPEYLAAGLLVVTSPGVGDLDASLTAAAAGIVLPTSDPTEADLEAAAAATLDALRDPALPARARALAEREFSLEGGVERYDEIYRRMGV